MTSSSPTNDAALHPLLEFALSGVTFLAGGFVLWFVFLAADFISTCVQDVWYARPPEHNGVPISLLNNSWGVALAYNTAFFITARFAGRTYRYRPALAVFVAYAAFLAIYLPAVDGYRSFSPEDMALLIPLFASPLGAIYGQRFFARTAQV